MPQKYSEPSSAIIGLGRIASLLEDDRLREKPASHAGAILMHPGAKLIAGADISAERRANFQNRWNVPVFETAEEMLAQFKPDILHICTPPEEHLAVLKQVLKYKIPLILCEKPLADSLSAAKKMVEMIEKSGSELMVNHERRYSLDYNHVKSVIEKGLYGKLLSIRALVCMGKSRTAKEMLLDDGTHMIDTILYLTGGEIISIQSRGEPDVKGGSIFVSFLCAKIPCTLETGGSRDHLIFELDLGFQTGRIRIGNGLYEEYKSKESPFYEKFKSLSNISVSFDRTEYFKRMYEDAVLAVTAGSNPLSTGLDALRDMEVIERIVKGCKKF